MITNSNNNKNLPLTMREEKGFQFEARVSDMLSSLDIEHDEVKTIARRYYKESIGQGPDFSIEVRGKRVCIEAKDWSWIYPSWSYHITDRFRGSGNSGDYNICVVDNKFSNGFFRLRHKLAELGIRLMTIQELYWFLIKLRKATKCTYCKRRLRARVRGSQHSVGPPYRGLSYCPSNSTMTRPEPVWCLA